MLAHESRQLPSWLIFDVRQEMKVRIILPVVVALWLSGCASTWDLSAKYQSVVGKQFRTIDDGWVWEMARHEYELVPYTLQSAKADLGRAGRKIAFVPAGTVLTVKEVKRRYSGGDWDILIAEIEVPATGKKYLFEELLGFSSATPADVEKRWLPVKEEPNQSPEPTPTAVTIPADAGLAPAAVVAHL